MTQMVMFSGAFVHITHSSPKLSMVAAYYMMASAFYSVVWFARLSILFSIIRIHPDEIMRQRLYVVGFLFFLTHAFLVSQLYWVCEPEPSWKQEESPQCELPKQVVICQLVTDVIADSILVIVPLRLIQTLIDTRLRRRLTVIFSTCLITTAVSLVHAAFILVHAGPQEVMAAITEDCVSLIVCNVPIIASALFGKWQRFTGGSSESKMVTKNVTLRFASFRNTRNRNTTGITTSTFGGGGGGFSGVISETTTTTQNGLGIGSTWLRWDRELSVDEEEDSSSSTSEPDSNVTSNTRVELDDRVPTTTTTTGTTEPEFRKRSDLAADDDDDDDDDDRRRHSVAGAIYPPTENKKVYFLEHDVS
ncbi:hypothetical protein D9757_011715 [Collybiopsis confluens]|uniref:Rhodopsin domain-containing protein n=1 Tax=Collybiopsis confluens TaxID=2823264 RepID=A0A8H5GDX2_9AGAR|nr:hypothetical protein D9757_011715 [Collybiopsis confluens]